MLCSRRNRLFAVAALLFTLDLAVYAGENDAKARTPDVMGKITGVAADGSAVIFGDKKQLIIKIPKKAKLTFSGTSKNKLAVGQYLKIWLASGTSDTAETVEVTQTSTNARRKAS